MVKTTFLKFVAFLILWGHLAGAGAATLTWSGGGADTLASNPDNWAGNVSPRNGDDVIFDGLSSKNCLWDLDIVVSSFGIYAGYAGTVVLDANLVIKEPIIWTGGGTDTRASNPENWADGIVPESGDNILMSGTEDCLWDLDITPASFRLNSGFTGTVALGTAFEIAGSLSVEGGFFDLHDKELSVEGDVFIDPGGVLYATSSRITVSGDWTNRGTVAEGTSTVILSGTDETVRGNTTFYNFVKKTTFADTLYFEAGSTQTVVNNLLFAGAENKLLSFRSTVEGQQWYLDAGGSRFISFSSIKDLSSTHPVPLDAADSQDGGNNTNINFGGDQCACKGNMGILVQAFSGAWRQPC